MLDLAELGIDVRPILLHIFRQEQTPPLKSAINKFVFDLLLQNPELVPIVCFIVGLVDKFTFYSFLSVFEQLDWVQNQVGQTKLSFVWLLALSACIKESYAFIRYGIERELDEGDIREIL